MFRSRTLHKKLDTIARICLATFHEVKAMQAAIDDLRTAVEEAKGVNKSVVTLVQEMASKFEAAKDDPAEIQQLASDLRASTGELAKAVESK